MRSGPAGRGASSSRRAWRRPTGSSSTTGPWPNSTAGSRRSHDAATNDQGLVLPGHRQRGLDPEHLLPPGHRGHHRPGRSDHLDGIRRLAEKDQRQPRARFLPEGQAGHPSWPALRALPERPRRAERHHQRRPGRGQPPRGGHVHLRQRAGHGRADQCVPLLHLQEDARQLRAQEGRLLDGGRRGPDLPCRGLDPGLAGARHPRRRTSVRERLMKHDGGFGAKSIAASRRLFPVIRAGAVIAVWVLCVALLGGSGQEAPKAGETKGGLLRLLGVEPSAESIDYVQTKTQFQLHTLLTEQRHPKTWYLGERIQEDTLAGLKMLSSVDDDVLARMDELAAAPEALAQAARAVERAILGGKKIYVHGCGATGRLAKQMESTFWRPFWRGVKADGKIWKKAARRLPAGTAIAESLVGEMTGADRALISSLEGFEDLPLIGRLQLHDRGIAKGDVVICVTEGGETSSVIGTVLAALDEWKSEPGYDPAESRKSLYFVYNNPDDRLMPFDRSRSVLTEPGITKINLTTGPQAITGSTRMQATTIETYVVAAIVETAVERVLAPALGRADMERLGFGAGTAGAGGTGVAAKLREFAGVLAGARAALADL